MTKPTIILATSNGVGMGHLARASAIALALKEVADPIIVSMAGGVAEIPDFMGIRCEYIPGRDRMWMERDNWDIYLRDRLLALAEETNAKLISFDGVVPYPGVIAAKVSNSDLGLVWVRRGLWQKKPQRFVLGLQSKMMDYIIEPGDYARSYDHGPTAQRGDAKLTAPVSLFQPESALGRNEARKALGLDVNRPAVLVQLGTGDNDVNHKMTAALTGLLGWKELQVILTKSPVDKDGNSLAPEGLDTRVVRYFPLASVLRAFDGAICATGYNGVHELLPAAIPTVFVSNIRGTDDQEARAQWCHDHGYALRGDQANLADITEKVRQLQNKEVRKRLHEKCLTLPSPTGGEEIAALLFDIAERKEKARPSKLTYSRLFLQDHINRGLRHVVYIGLRRLALIYRKLNPYAQVQVIAQEPPMYGDHTSASDLHSYIRGDVRYEHLITGASEEYHTKRRQIAWSAYGERTEKIKRRR